MYESSENRMVNVTLIATDSPAYQTQAADPLAISVLSGYIQRQCENVTVSLLDTQFHSAEIIKKQLLENKPDIIGISVKIASYKVLEQTMKIIEETKKEDAMVVLGGVLPTFIPEKTLEMYPDVLIALGEGEPALEGLVKYKKETSRKLETVPNLVFKDKGNIVKTKRKAFDMKKWVAPDRSLLAENLKKGGVPVMEFSRGCPGHCVYCYAHTNRKGGYRKAPVSEIIKDIKNILKIAKKNERDEIEIIPLADDSGFVDLDHLVTICEVMKEERISIKWNTSARIKDITYEDISDNAQKVIIEKLKFLKENGLQGVYLGVESGSNAQLMRYKKGLKREEIQKGLDILDSLGLGVEVGLILLDHQTNIDEYLDNLCFLEETQLYKKASYLLNVIKIQNNTPYQKILKKKNLLHEKALPEDPVHYEAEFEDPKIGFIADEIATAYFDDEEFLTLYYAFKIKVRKGDIPLEIMEGLRSMEFFRFREIVRKIQKDENFTENKREYLDMVRALNKKRFEYMKNFMN